MNDQKHDQKQRTFRFTERIEAHDVNIPLIQRQLIIVLKLI